MVSSKSVYMKKLFTLVGLLSAINLLNAQTVIWSETFDPAQTWNLNVATGTNDQYANLWYISDAEGGVAAGGCGVGGNGNQTLFIGAEPTFAIGSGATYNAGGLCGFGVCVVTNKRTESPVINTTGQSGLVLGFDYIANGQPGADFCSVVYNDGSGWQTLVASLLSPTCGGGQGQWTHMDVNLPASCNNNPNLKIGFVWTNNDDGAGTDPSVAINDITISTNPQNNPTVNTSNPAKNGYCQGDNITVPFQSTGTFQAGNIYTLVLSDASGSFTSAFTLGTLTSVANTDSISGIIPITAPAGSGYKVRISASTPAVTGVVNSGTFNIYALPIPSVSQIGFGSLTVTPCAGCTYQWSNANGPISGATDTTFKPPVAGNYTITITTAEGCSASADYFSTLSIESLSNTALSVFPNPAVDFVNVSLPASITGSVVRVLDMSGRIVSETKIQSVPHVIDVRSLPSGTYVLDSSSGKSLLLKK